MVVGSKTNFLTSDLDLWVECLPWDVFLRVPNPYLHVFRRKPRKTPNDWVEKARQWLNQGTYRLPVFESRTTQLLMGPRTDSLTSMLYLGFKPRTFDAAAGISSHYTAWSATNFQTELHIRDAMVKLNKIYIQVDIRALSWNRTKCSGFWYLSVKII